MKCPGSADRVIYRYTNMKLRGGTVCVCVCTDHVTPQSRR